MPETGEIGVAAGAAARVAVGALAPGAGARPLAHGDGPLAPLEGALAPLEGALAPLEGALAPAKGFLGPAEGVLGPADVGAFVPGALLPMLLLILLPTFCISVMRPGVTLEAPVAIFPNWALVPFESPLRTAPGRPTIPVIISSKALPKSDEVPAGFGAPTGFGAPKGFGEPTGFGAPKGFGGPTGFGLAAGIPVGGGAGAAMASEADRTRRIAFSCILNIGISTCI